jgi:hypothetical protein
MRILVTGATGYVGGRLVPRLLAIGHQIVCLARDPSHISGRGWEKVDVRRGDALDAGSLLPAMEGVDVAYYLIHSMNQREGRFEECDWMAAEHFWHGGERGLPCVGSFTSAGWGRPTKFLRISRHGTRWADPAFLRGTSHEPRAAVIGAREASRSRSSGTSPKRSC